MKAVSDSEFKTTKEFKKEYDSYDPIKKNWESEKKQLKEILNNIEKIESIKDFDKIEEIVTKNKIIYNNINKIDDSEYNIYSLKNDKLIQSIKDRREINEINTKFNLENINDLHIILDNINENKDDLNILKKRII